MLPTPSLVTPYPRYCVYSQIGGGWEMSNHDTATITKYHHLMTQVKVGGLGRDDHVLKQGPARGTQDRALDPQHRGWLHTISRSSHTLTTTPRMKCPATRVRASPLYTRRKTMFMHVKTYLPVRL